MTQRLFLPPPARPAHILAALVLGLLGASGASAAPAGSGAELAAGRAAFSPCASCHSLGRSSRGSFGPQLRDVIGRRAGSLGDYAYTPAMKRAGFVWNAQTLAAFVKDPQAVVPGTRMRFVAIGYDEQRLAALTRYLRSQTPSSSPPDPSGP